MVLGVDALLISTGLEDFVLRPRFGGAPSKVNDPELARRAASAIRFGLEAGEPHLVSLVRQLLAPRLFDVASLQQRPHRPKGTTCRAKSTK